MLLSQSVYVFEPLQLFLNPTVFKEWQTPTISTGSIQNSGEKYIRLTKSSTSILLEPKLFRRDNNMSEISFSNRFYEEFDWNYADLDIIDRLQINIWIRRVFATISINLIQSAQLGSHQAGDGLQLYA